jgi:hypothetical protein
MKEETLRDWAALAQIVDRHKQENWLYRGVTRSDHKLIPKIGRKGALGPSYRYREQDEKKFWMSLSAKRDP